MLIFILRSSNGICRVDYKNILIVVSNIFSLRLISFCIFTTKNRYFPSYFVKITFKFSLRIHISPIKFKYVGSLSTDPPIEFTQPKSQLEYAFKMKD